jgi:hypothetical protein
MTPDFSFAGVPAGEPLLLTTRESSAVAAEVCDAVGEEAEERLNSGRVSEGGVGLEGRGKTEVGRK